MGTMDVSFGGGMNLLFTLIPILVIFVFFFVFGTILVHGIKGAKQWRRNNASPVLTVQAQVVTKRADTSYHTHHHSTSDNAAMNYHSSSTRYYVTFEVESGDRLEFEVPSSEYGMLVEGDRGGLTFQGTRYQGFERIRG
ncbi:DUF2500 domain-containing protein [Youxingia wuxianensis]|nr:DUF2500 domain-containing protein [Youxingia wuxianensis]